MVEEHVKLMNKCEARWADGRAHCAGPNLTASDFSLLAAYTSFFSNPNIRNPSFSERMVAHCANLPNVQRVLQGVMSLCQAQVDAL